MKNEKTKRLIVAICFVLALGGMLILLSHKSASEVVKIASGGKIGMGSEIEKEADKQFKIIERSGAEFFPNDLNGYTLGYVSGNHFTAQSFLISKTENYWAIEMKLRKYGFPMSSLNIEIQTDNENKPSGEIVKNAIFVLGPTRIGSSDYEWIYLMSDDKFNLVAGERYWIVPTCENCDEYNKYDWQGDAESGLTYSDGGSLDTIDFGKSWQRYDQEDMAFRILYYEKVSY